MGDKTKITLSAAEQSIVKDRQWILTKINILQKVQHMMHAKIPVIRHKFLSASLSLDSSILASVPKISKGENYRQLPYVMLDYPAYFTREDIFACRTFFWWGNFFSIQLLLTGKYKEIFQDRVLERLSSQSPQLKISIHDSEWEHHFEEDNFVSYSEAQAKKIDFTAKNFLKIGVQFSLDDWSIMPQHFDWGYDQFVALLRD